MKTSLFGSVVLAVLFTFAPFSSAHAFHINEHLAITDRAVFGLQKCGLLPQGWDMNWKAVIAAADRDEDLDVIRKIKYSHYFNPNHPLSQGPRVDSSVSILESTQEIKDLLAARNVNEVYKLVGRIVHHIQDSSVPAHAVPVSHLADDGFEKADMTSYFAEPISIEECRLLGAAEPLAILKDNAFATLAALEQPVTYLIEGQATTTPWSQAFWSFGAGNEFGKYGPLGDTFGQSSFKLSDGRAVSVDPAQYVQFKRMQVNAAVRATQNAILWANKELGL